MAVVGDLKLPVLGESDLLSYLETNTGWIDRIAPEDCATRPHALFVRVHNITHFSRPIGAGAAVEAPHVLAEHKARLGTNENYSIVLDYSREGPGFDGHCAASFQALHELLAQLAIPPEQVLFLHHNFNLQDPRNPYFGWCQRNGLRPMRMRYSHVWLLEQAALLRRRYGDPDTFRSHRDRLVAALSPQVQQKTSKYLSFNYFPRFHRVLLLLSLMDRDLIDQGRVSFPGFRIPEVPTDFLHDVRCHLPHWRAGARLAPLLERLQARAPLRVDTDDTTSKNMLNAHFVDTPFLSTLFSVVTETGFNNAGSEWRITEKFLKPIVHMHPFIIAGEPGSLELIRDLGFRTFSTLFDESYDGVIEPEQRLERIMDVIEGLCGRSIEQLTAEVHGILPVLDHNLHHAVYGLWPRVREESEYPVINDLLDDLAAPGPRIATPFPHPVASIATRRPMLAHGPGAAMKWPDTLRETIRIGANFDWNAPQFAAGRVYRVLRCASSPGNHCVLFRVDCDLSRPIALSLDVRAVGAQRMLIQIKDPPQERYRGVFDFHFGIFSGSQNGDAFSDIRSHATYKGDQWFTLHFAGQVGEGAGPLDVLLYIGMDDFVFDGDEGIELWLANFALERAAGADAAPLGLPRGGAGRVALQDACA